jgi:murein DD-endopeptidase MepM/ murein hydrolase activator NlpD
MIVPSCVTFFAHSLFFAVALACLADDYDLLNKRHLILPIEGLTARDIQDTFDQKRAGGKPHEASDLLAPRGTPIMAVEDGVIQKLFLSKPGGLTIYEFDRLGVYCYYYAHLDRYAEGLREGMRVKQGEVIGYVGTSGNAPPNTPHLHFAIFKLGLEKHWWQGVAINPYPVLMKLAESAK